MPPPLAVYVHFPWCVRKCPYCDFNSHEVRGDWPEADYLQALIADLEMTLPQMWGRRVSSIFIGGGTPSLMQPATVEGLLAAIRARVSLLPDAEITLEANPGTVESARFAGYRAAGINRISIGIQSFDGRHLAALGRIHDEAEAHAAVEAALARFDNVNLDLMYGLPGQELPEARRDMEIATRYAPAQISAYQLTLEPNTLFHRAPPPLPDPDLAADMQDMVEELLADHAYRHYETSAFAR
ncbi:MAG: radical SAM family heme chaperone HemW, partial [Rhodocyclaceae bacterium]